MILSKDYENKLLDLFRGYSIEPITKFYIGLVKTNGEEVSASSYSRVEYDASNIAWLSTDGTVGSESTGDTGTISNVANISWGTSLEDWGVVNRVRFFLESSGESYFCDHETENTNITNGTDVSMLAGEFVISTRAQ